MKIIKKIFSIILYPIYLPFAMIFLLIFGILISLSLRNYDGNENT